MLIASPMAVKRLTTWSPAGFRWIAIASPSSPSPIPMTTVAVIVRALPGAIGVEGSERPVGRLASG